MDWSESTTIGFLIPFKFSSAFYKRFTGHRMSPYIRVVKNLNDRVSYDANKFKIFSISTGEQACSFSLTEDVIHSTAFRG